MSESSSHRAPLHNENVAIDKHRQYHDDDDMVEDISNKTSNIQYHNDDVKTNDDNITSDENIEQVKNNNIQFTPIKKAPHYVSVLKALKLSNAADCRWSHACNSCELINRIVNSVSNPIDFIEADIVYAGCITGAIMAHNIFDINSSTQLHSRRFQYWLEHIVSLNRVVGLKLDFKMPQAVLHCVNLLAHMNVTVPVWLNADVMIGPRGKPPGFSYAEANVFIEQCKRIDGAVLSLGWSTSDITVLRQNDDTHSSDTATKCLQHSISITHTRCQSMNVTSTNQTMCKELIESTHSRQHTSEILGYSDDMINEMIDMCLAHKLDKFNVTFAVRACDVIVSITAILRLLDVSELWSLTIWNGREGVDTHHHLFLRQSLPSHRTFYDTYLPGSNHNTHQSHDNAYKRRHTVNW